MIGGEPTPASGVDPARAATGPAPADGRPHAAWPWWRKVLAYLALAALAAAAIWYVDLKAHRPAGKTYPTAPLRGAAA